MADVLNEEWRAVLGGAYEVSSIGRVRRAKPGRKTHPGRILHPTLMKIGYLKVAPVVDGKNVYTMVHTLVAEAFIGPRPHRFHINHIDGDKTNNCASNLEYITPSENSRHAFRSGLSPSGMHHGNARLTDDAVREIRTRRASGETATALAKEYGVSVPTISEICHYRKRKSV